MTRLIALSSLLALSALPVLAQDATPTPAAATPQAAVAGCPADGTGIRAHSGGSTTGVQQGTRTFVDADGDGICDLATTRQVRGAGQAAGQGRGAGTGFVDANGDGICDHATATTSTAAARTGTASIGRARRGGR